MTSDTAAKIDSVNQQLKLLEWKKEDYTAIISKLKNFKDKYLSSSAGGSLSSKFYITKTAKTEYAGDSAYVSVTIPSDSGVTAVNLKNITTATASAAKTEFTVSPQITINFSSPVDLTGKTMELTVDGETKTITFSKSYATVGELAADIQTLADTAFGTDRLSVCVSGNNIIINSDGSAAGLSAGITNDALSVTGLTLTNAETNCIDTAATIANNKFATALIGDTFEFTINGKSFSFTGDTTIDTVINTVNSSDAGVKLSYSSITDKFTLTSSVTGVTGGITISDQTGNFMNSVIGTLSDVNYKAGTDASVYIDGVKVTRSSNTFTIDGITYSLKSNTANSININVTDSIDTALENIKGFVKDYNDLLDLINKEINETRNKDYKPLTKAEEDAMSETEVTKWNEKARSGLLKNDTLLSGIASSLRESMYTAVANLNDNSTNLEVTLAGIGIATESYSSKGKLVIDEEKLTLALTNNADAVISLFTQKSDKIYLPANTDGIKAERYNESGIMYRISDILENSVGTLLATGSLLTVAGYEGTSTEANNIISRSMGNYKDKLTDLEELLDNQETRYYAQFTAMEQAISKMNQQISAITGYQ
jgi:flagellar hook-associated protein 2